MLVFNIRRKEWNVVSRLRNMKGSRDNNRDSPGDRMMTMTVHSLLLLLLVLLAVAIESSVGGKTTTM